MTLNKLQIMTQDFSNGEVASDVGKLVNGMKDNIAEIKAKEMNRETSSLAQQWQGWLSQSNTKGKKNLHRWTQVPVVQKIKELPGGRVEHLGGVLEAEATRLQKLWGCTSDGISDQWEPLEIENRAVHDVEQLCSACRTFSSGAAYSLDGWHPRHFLLWPP